MCIRDRAQEDTVVSRAWQEHIGNIKVEYEFIPYNDFLTKMDIYLASGDIPDILPVYDPCLLYTSRCV